MPTSRSAQFIVYAQYPDGPVIAVQVENEFGPSDPEHPGRSEYFALIEDTLRSNESNNKANEDTETGKARAKDKYQVHWAGRRQAL